MSRNILIIQGHPNRKSFCAELEAAYVQGAHTAECQIETLVLADLDFAVSVPSPETAELEPDMTRAQELLTWADHLVLFYPIWWGGMPALLKGFFDRVLQPGFAYRYRPDSQLWDKLLLGKSARVIVTMDGPIWHNHLTYGKPAERAIQKSVLEFCGIHPVHLTNLGPLSTATDTHRAEWIRKVEGLGQTRD